MSRRHLLDHTIVVFMCGVFAGLLGHYIEYGWNPGARLWGKIMLLLGLAAGIVLTLCGLFSPDKESQSMEQSKEKQ